MKKTKKFLALSMACVMTASLAACTGNQTAATTGATAPADSQAETAAEESKAEETKGSEQAADSRVTDGNGWYLWDEEGVLTIEGRDATGKTAVVAAGKYEAAQAGLEVLQAGGNAVDAAVAVGFALGVTEPNSSGLGGGGFMTIHSETGETIFVDFRERAPQGATPAMWVVDAEGKVVGNQKAIGGKSIGIPGEVAGMDYAFKTYGSGKVTWEQVMAPAVKLAEEGFIVTPTLYNDMFGSYDAMIAYPEFGKIFLKDDGFNYEVGELFKNPDMAKTLKKIAAEGKDAFYKGPMAQAIVDVTNKYGGVFSLADLENYQVQVMEPVKGTYRGYQIISSPLPSSGGTHVVQALNIMENFDIKGMGFGSKDNLHVLAESFKILFNDRAKYMGDPAYVKVPVKGIADKEYAKAQAAQIDMEKIAEYEEINPWIYEHEDTTHYSVADAKGNMVSVTKTVNGLFGAKVAVDGYGFVLNNEMDDFSADPESPNAIAPGKTPLSSMSPTIVLKEDGSPFMVLGSPGATKIITTVTQIISNVIDHGMTMQEAINAPRIFNNATSPISYETRLEEGVMKDLEAMGYELEASDSYNRTFGSVNAVMYGENELLGGADPRRDGKAVGY